jgi:hypothetical protein
MELVFVSAIRFHKMNGTWPKPDFGCLESNAPTVTNMSPKLILIKGACYGLLHLRTFRSIFICGAIGHERSIDPPLNRIDAKC